MATMFTKNPITARERNCRNVVIISGDTYKSLSEREKFNHHSLMQNSELAFYNDDSDKFVCINIDNFAVNRAKFYEICTDYKTSLNAQIIYFD